MITLAIIPMRPSALLWALAAAVVVLLYVRSISPPQVTVARAYLWRQVLGEPRSSTRIWRRRRILSASIHVAVIGLFVLAGLDLCLKQPRTVVFVVDNSLSMKAIEGESDRLAQARSLVRKHLATIGPREHVALVTTSGQPLVVCPAEQNLERVAAMNERIRAVDEHSHVSGAIDLALRQAVPGTRVEVHVLSDGCFPNADSVGTTSNVLIHPLGSANGNAGVGRIAVRRYPDELRRFQLMAEVVNRGTTAFTAPLRVLVNDTPVHQSECAVDSDSTTAIVADLEFESGGPLLAVLDWPDCLPADNRLATILPDMQESAGDAPPGFSECRLEAQQVRDTRSPPGWVVLPFKPAPYGVAPLWAWFVLVAFLLLAVEWGLFHRRWTC